jgi:hypothetical protein
LCLLLPPLLSNIFVFHSKLHNQGCQMIYLGTINVNFYWIFKGHGMEILVYFMTIWYILGIFGTLYGHLVLLCQLYIFTNLGFLNQTKLATLRKTVHSHMHMYACMYVASSET